MLTLTVKIAWAKPQFTAADFAATELWLKTNILQKLPAGVSGTYSWHNKETTTAVVVLSWTKAEFSEADFSALKTWIQNNITTKLDPNSNASWEWTVAS